MAWQDRAAFAGQDAARTGVCSIYFSSCLCAVGGRYSFVMDAARHAHSEEETTVLYPFSLSLSPVMETRIEESPDPVIRRRSPSLIFCPDLFTWFFFLSLQGVLPYSYRRGPGQDRPARHPLPRHHQHLQQRHVSQRF